MGDLTVVIEVGCLLANDLHSWAGGKEISLLGRGTWLFLSCVLRCCLSDALVQFVYVCLTKMGGNNFSDALRIAFCFYGRAKITRSNSRLRKLISCWPFTTLDLIVSFQYVIFFNLWPVERTQTPSSTTHFSSEKRLENKSEREFLLQLISWHIYWFTECFVFEKKSIFMQNPRQEIELASSWSRLQLYPKSVNSFKRTLLVL